MQSSFLRHVFQTTFNMNYKIVLIVTIFFTSACTIPVHGASLNMNDEDYNTLMRLLAEQELEEHQRNEALNENTINEHLPYEADYPLSHQQQEKIVGVNAEGGFGLGTAVQTAVSFQKPSFSALIGAPTEVLGLAQTFLELKSEVVEKFNALLLDNFDVIKNIYRVFATKIRHLHSFTLKGVWVLRKILEFTLQMFVMWEVNKPQLAVDFGIDKLINAGVGASVGYNK